MLAAIIEPLNFLARFGRHAVILCGGHAGLGDDLLLTVVAREFARRGASRTVVVTRCSELFAGNPDIAGTLPRTPRFVRLLGLLGVRVLSPSFSLGSPSETGRRVSDVHMLTQAAASIGLPPPHDPRPWLRLSPEEMARGARARGCILVQSSISEPGLAKPNKEWFPDRARAAAQRLVAQGHRVAQIGLPTDAALGVGEDFRDTRSPREVAALLGNARLFVGLVGFLMHAARAVECPSVILFGGREAPWVSGYPANENLFTSLPCSPCWEWSRCDFDRECMRRITAEDVCAAVDRLLARTSPRADLPVSTA